MTLAVVTASFTLALREPALAVPVSATSLTVTNAAQAGTSLTAHHRQRPTPCQKSVLPGTVNTCPLSNFSFNGVAVTTTGLTTVTDLDAARWTFNDTSRPPQCLGLSPYRPPCARA